MFLGRSSIQWKALCEDGDIRSVRVHTITAPARETLGKTASRRRRVIVGYRNPVVKVVTSQSQTTRSKSTNECFITGLLTLSRFGDNSGELG
jgi:hypothetical protein